MESWLEIVLRQMILYSLPMLISLTAVCWFEARLTGRKMPHAFFPLNWRGAWLPWLASIAFHRGIIFALPQMLGTGAKAASARLAGHILLSVLGFFLYAWSLQYPPAAGLPPLHHWWAKILMFFNLCLVFLHMIPMPGMLCGEILLPRLAGRWPVVAQRLQAYAGEKVIWLWLLIAASPLADAILGAYVIFPVYGQMATWAFALAR
ncbi:MAG: hypothetical protein R8K53_03215 [Mariprofundaceae bacterium]